MNIEKERELFFKWLAGQFYDRGMSQIEAEEAAKVSIQCDMESKRMSVWMARAALDAKEKQQGHPCRIISADLSTGIFTLQMSYPDFSVSAGPKYLCDAPMENKE